MNIKPIDKSKKSGTISPNDSSLSIDQDPLAKHQVNRITIGMTVILRIIFILVFSIPVIIKAKQMIIIRGTNAFVEKIDMIGSENAVTQ
ncbi:MAG: hypothetical protein VX617_01520 [Pseudomonadota bacterium]|nr:hypothetical protein [Pseudomonadota bacterium]